MCLFEFLSLIFRALHSTLVHHLDSLLETGGRCCWFGRILIVVPNEHPASIDTRSHCKKGSVVSTVITGTDPDLIGTKTDTRLRVGEGSRTVKDDDSDAPCFLKRE